MNFKILGEMRFVLLIFLLVVYGCKDSEKSDGILEDEKLNNSEISVSNENRIKISSIDDIQKEYSRVNKMWESKKLDSVGFTYNCYNERSGTVSFYSDENGLRVIQHSYNEYSHYSSTHRYFIKDDQPFFIYYNDLAWQFEGDKDGKPGTKDDITQKRYYIINGKLERCLAKQYTTRSHGDNPQPDEVANKEVPCPSINKLMEDYNLLLKHRNETNKIKCLDENISS